MTDILGAIVNVLHIIRRVVEYVSAFRDGKEDRKRLLSVIYAASGVLETFRLLKEASPGTPWQDRLIKLSGPQGAVTKYFELLSEMRRKSIRRQRTETWLR